MATNLRQAARNAVLILGLALTVMASVQARAQAPLDLVKRAVAAQGGEGALRAVKTLSMTAQARHWEPEQSFVAGGEPRFLGDSTVKTTIDVAQGAVRSDWQRDMKYPAADKLAFSEITTPSVAAVTVGQDTKAASGIRQAAGLREALRASPLLMLRALDAPERLSAAPPQRGRGALPAVTYTENGAAFTIRFDRKTGLPQVVRTRDDDNIRGDSDFDLVLGDWKQVGDIKIAHTQTYQLNGVKVGEAVLKDVAVNPTVADDVFAVSDDVKNAFKPAADDATVPYQWVIRRLWLGRFVDSDTVMTVPGGALRLVEIAPNVQQVLGGSHNNLIVAMKDGLAVFDAPIGEIQSRFVIDAAKEKYPGKPIKYLVLTHHHMDHSGGTRTYAAEGATVIAPAPDKRYFDAVLRAPHTVVPDALTQAKLRAPPKVVEVKDTLTLRDDEGEIRLIRIPNPHVEGMLIAHVVKDNVVWVTDIWSPMRDKERTAASMAFADALKAAGISGATIAGGHGASGKQSDLDALMAQR